MTKREYESQRKEILNTRWIDSEEKYGSLDCLKYAYIESLEKRVAELEKLVKDWQEIAQYAGRIIEDYKHLMPIEATSDIEQALYNIAKAPKEES